MRLYVGNWDCYGERRSRTDLTLDGHGTTMGLDGTFDDHQPQSSTRRCSDILSAMKQFKQVVLIFFWNANPFISHTQDNVGIVTMEVNVYRTSSRRVLAQGGDRPRLARQTRRARTARAGPRMSH